MATPFVAMPARIGALTPGLNHVRAAYVVDELDRATERCHSLWGMGPCIMRRHIAMEEAWYHGTPTTLDISAAFVQSVQVQIEFIERHDDTLSALHDMHAPVQQGLHHVAIVPRDPQATVERFMAQGYPVKAELRTRGGRGAWFPDTRPLLGHMIELDCAS